MEKHDSESATVPNSPGDPEGFTTPNRKIVFASPTAPKRKCANLLSPDNSFLKKPNMSHSEFSSAVLSMLRNIQDVVNCIKSTVNIILDHEQYNRKVDIVDDEARLHSRGYGPAWDEFLENNPQHKGVKREDLATRFPSVEVKILDYLLELEDPMVAAREEYKNCHDETLCANIGGEHDTDCSCFL